MYSIPIALALSKTWASSKCPRNVSYSQKYITNLLENINLSELYLLVNAAASPSRGVAA